MSAPGHPFQARQRGVVVSTKGFAAVAKGLALPPQSLCRVGSPFGPLAESIAFSDGHTTLMALEPDQVWTPGDPVYSEPMLRRPPAALLLGRVIDGLARPLDNRFLDPTGAMATQAPGVANPMGRRRLSSALDVGVRALNGLIPVANGQRLGIFAGSGVGKSTLLSMMAKHTKADRVVIALIGERSREVREFVEDNLGAQGLAKSVVVAVSAGHTPLMKIQGAHLACDIADEFKNRGESCLLIMDSLTRYAMACREVGLACGETPATKGYPPSVFSRLNALVERAGPGSEAGGQGDITGFYTVLSEGDDMQDPVADNARAILDGHIVLARAIAERGVYPPIDVAASVSRAASAIASHEQLALMRKYRQLLGAYTQNEDLIKAGAYQAGQDAELDLAIAKIGALRAYAQQGVEEACDIEQALAQLRQALA
jgi:flagellum-specific ATP synthase